MTPPFFTLATGNAILLPFLVIEVTWGATEWGMEKTKTVNKLDIGKFPKCVCVTVRVHRSQFAKQVCRRIESSGTNTL